MWFSGEALGKCQAETPEHFVGGVPLALLTGMETPWWRVGSGRSGAVDHAGIALQRAHRLRKWPVVRHKHPRQAVQLRGVAEEFDLRRLVPDLRGQEMMGF